MIDLNMFLQKLYLAKYEQDNTFGEKAKPYFLGLLGLGTIILLARAAFGAKPKKSQSTPIARPNQVQPVDSGEVAGNHHHGIVMEELSTPFSKLNQEKNGQPTRAEVIEFVREHHKKKS